jgi:hypothetical protein
LGCSERAWVFSPSGAPTGKSFDEAKRNFELQRDKEFTVHVCAKHPRAKSQSTKRDVKQDWEKLYRAAIIESDWGKLLQRVEDAEAAILERSRCLSKSSANSGKRAGSYHSGPVHFELAAGKSRRLTRLLRERERLHHLEIMGNYRHEAAAEKKT